MLLLDGKPLKYDAAFTHNGIQYPSNWLRHASWADKAALGIVEAPNPPTWDQRFAWGYLEDGTLNYKDHEQLINTWVSQVKQTAGSLLAQTDWYIIRQADSGTPAPSDVVTRREEIRSYSNLKEQAILDSPDAAALAEYVTSPSFHVWSAEEEAALDSPSVDTLQVTDVPPDTLFGSDTITFSGGSTSGSVSTGDSLFIS